LECPRESADNFGATAGNAIETSALDVNHESGVIN
jgi:hypothetical protein